MYFNMIDWTKERTNKNYCGWCTGYPPSSSCSGECFKNENNKVNHALDMLNQIPIEIEKLKIREKEFKECLTIKK